MTFDRAAAKAVLTATVNAVFGDQARLKIEIGEIGDVLVGDEHDIAALAAVAAIRAAAVNIFLASERNRTVAAIARLDANFDFVDEHRRQDNGKSGKRKAESGNDYSLCNSTWPSSNKSTRGHGGLLRSRGGLTMLELMLQTFVTPVNA